MSPEENALRAQCQKLEAQNELMRKLSTRDGFYSQYFEEIPRSRTNEEAFNKVNDLYRELFGEDRYSDFDSFKKVTRRYFNKNK